MTDTVVPSLIVHKLLNQNNYEDWSLRVKTYLLAKDLWDVVEATTEPPRREDGEVEYKAWRKSNAEALHSIQISCGDDTFSFIRGTGTAKAAWDILAEKLKSAEASQATGTDEISDNHKNNPTIVDAEPENGSAIEESSDEGHEDNHANQTLLNLVENDEWDAAIEFLVEHPKAVSARLSDSGGTMLHWVVAHKTEHIAKKLVDKMRPKDLLIRDSQGSTALHYVIKRTPESVQLLKCMVEKNEKLLGVAFPATKRLPVVEAAVLVAKKKAEYLYSVTPPETLDDYDCATLISFGFKSRSLDIAWDLIQRYPKLAIGKDYYGGTPLNQLAGMRYAFLSKSSLNLSQLMIYHAIPMPTVDKNKKPIPTTDDVCINVQKPENGDQNNQGQRNLFRSGTSLQRGLVVQTFYELLGFDRMYQMKLVHAWIREFLPLMCKVTKNKTVNELQGLKTAMFLAIKRGHVEYIYHLCKANGDFQHIVNENGMGIFQYAAKCRQHEVFNLLYGIDDQNLLRSHVSRKDKLGNNMLHAIGTISSVAQINHIRGPALQMQRELQWFEEVEREEINHTEYIPSIASVIDREEINHTEYMTPRELFIEGHKELMKEGEKAMKDTATSCTVFGTLIATIMFAAAFTVPGGNNQNTGLPIFLSERAFTIFIVSDAISLFSSVTSIMIFLGIFTSRYSEDDFDGPLQKTMIAGLCTLFVSIFTMLIAFLTTLHIMLPKNLSNLLITLLALIPVESFIYMQFPLLLELVFSTFGAGVFDGKI